MTDTTDKLPERPLVTFALFAYNQENYIREAVKSALEQTYEPLEIILSDDFSDDHTFAIMQRIAGEYNGNHKIILNRNSENIGIGSHVNAVMEIAKGEVIVVAGGDDISFPNRVQEVAKEFFRGGKKPYSVWSSAIYIDVGGKIIDQPFPLPPQALTDAIIARNTHPVIGATHAWSKEVFDVFGPLMPSIVFEDNAISFRSYLLGDIVFIDKELVYYRRHNKNVTNFLSTTDHRALYERATSRIGAALVGVRQRKRDLELAIVDGLIEKKRASLMDKELARFNRKLKIRYETFSKFPNISFVNFYRSIFDIEIAKFYLRSLIYVLAGRGSVE
tara:strand:+ start:6014 stop:7009 length:996 start_codon:yes stop_codon:yes gene_type:complete